MKSGTFVGAATVAAKPGEVIILWANGFGPTSPVPPPGVFVPAGTITYSTATLPSISLQFVPTTVHGAALAPGFAGLYQIAFQVPADFPDGDYPLTGTVGGAPILSSGIVLAVRR